MKTVKGIIAILFLATLTFVSCKKSGDNSTTNDSLTHIPQDVSMVTAINMDQLLTKADWEAVKQMEFFQEMIEDVQRKAPAFAKLLQNPYESGVDMKKKAYISYDVDPINSKKVYTALTMNIKDLKAFEGLVKATIDSEIQAGEGFQYVNNSPISILAWNDQLIVMGGSKEKKDIIKKTSKYFQTKKESSATQIADLQKSLSGNHDISNWMTSNILADNQEAQFMLGLAGFDPKDLKENFVHNSFDFDQGAINGLTDFFLQKGLANDINLLFKDKVKTDFTNYFPADPGVLFSTAVDLKGINQILAERPQAKAMLNFSLQEFGLTSDDLANTLGGDLIFGTYGENETSKSLFATNVLDQTLFNKFISLATEYELIAKESANMYQLNPASIARFFGRSVGYSIKPETRMMLKDDLVFFSEDQIMLQQIQAGGFKGAAIKSDTYNKAAGNLLGALVDFEVLKKYSDDIKDLDLTDFSMQLKRNQFNMTTKMKDQNNNSLNTIFKMINNQYLKEKNKDI